MPDRVVRFTEHFFDQLDQLLPADRQPDGSPSATDFLLLDLPRVRDALAANYQASTLPIDGNDVRVLISAGVLVPRFVLYTALVNEVVEVFWLELDLSRPD